MTLLVVPIHDDPRLRRALDRLRGFFPTAPTPGSPTAPVELPLLEHDSTDPPADPDAELPLHRILRHALTAAATRETPCCIVLAGVFGRASGSDDPIAAAVDLALGRLGDAFDHLAAAGQVAGTGHHPARRFVRIVPWLWADQPPERWPAACFRTDLRLSLQALTPILHTGLLTSGADRGWDPHGHARLFTDLLSLHAASTHRERLDALLPHAGDRTPRAAVLRSALVDCPDTDHQRLLLLEHLRTARGDRPALLLDPTDLDAAVTSLRQPGTPPAQAAQRRLRPLLDRLEDRLDPAGYRMHAGHTADSPDGAPLPVHTIGPLAPRAPWPGWTPGGWPAHNAPSTLARARHAAVHHIRHLEQHVLGQLQTDALAEVETLVRDAEEGLRQDLRQLLTRTEDGPGQGIARAIAWLHHLEDGLATIRDAAPPRPPTDDGVDGLVRNWQRDEDRLRRDGADVPSTASAFLPSLLLLLGGAAFAAATSVTLVGPILAALVVLPVAGLLAWWQRRRIQDHLHDWERFRERILSDTNDLIDRRVRHIDRQVNAVRRAAVRDLHGVARSLRERLTLEARGLARLVVDEVGRIREHEEDGLALQQREGSGYHITDFADDATLHVDQAAFTHAVADRLLHILGDDRRMLPVPIERWDALLDETHDATRRQHSERERQQLARSLTEATRDLRLLDREPAVLRDAAFDTEVRLLVLHGDTLARLLGPEAIAAAVRDALHAGDPSPEVHHVPGLPHGTTTLTFRRTATVSPAQEAP